MIQSNFKQINFWIGPLLFLLVLNLNFADLSSEGNAIMACTIWIAYWWITEAAELAVTSLLPVVIFPLSGGLSIEEASTAYGSPLIFLFLGGFIIGLALEKWNLHKRIAYSIIKKTGVSERKVLLGFMIATAFLSMWISNTATAIMMLPIGASVISQFRSNDRFGKNMMLGIAYAASIGGMGTLIGTPPNIILAGVIRESMNVEISFYSWMIFATPFSIILLFISWFYLSRGLKSQSAHDFEFIPEPLGPMSKAEKRVLIVFSLTAFFWLSRTFLWNTLVPAMDDTMIAIAGALLMFLIPAGKGKDKLMDWKSAKTLPWDVLLIFGAGLAIARGFSRTDLTTWLAAGFQDINLWPFLILLIIIAAINFLTEITSNTATASIMLPLLYSMSGPLEVNPLSLLIGAALACSCAFMLPVATPPNAIVFSSGHLKIKDMVQAGLLMNILSIIFIFAFVQLFISTFS